MTRYSILLGKKPPPREKINYFMGIDIGFRTESPTNILVGHLKGTQFVIDHKRILNNQENIAEHTQCIYQEFSRHGDIVRARSDHYAGPHQDNLPGDYVQMSKHWRDTLGERCFFHNINRIAKTALSVEFKDSLDLALSLAVDHLEQKRPPQIKYMSTPKGLSFFEKYKI
jgi:hypothetical protein